MTTANVYVTGHATERIKGRYGLKSGKKIQHLCNIAYERGVKSENAKGALRKWIDRKTRSGTFISCYHEYAFVFSDSAKCITILQIPTGIKKNFSKLVIPA